MIYKPVAPTVSPKSTKPEDVKAWEDYYTACDHWTDMHKPCMDRNW